MTKPFRRILMACTHVTRKAQTVSDVLRPSPSDHVYTTRDRGPGGISSEDFPS